MLVSAKVRKLAWIVIVCGAITTAGYLAWRANRRQVAVSGTEHSSRSAPNFTATHQNVVQMLARNDAAGAVRALDDFIATVGRDTIPEQITARLFRANILKTQHSLSQDEWLAIYISELRNVQNAGEILSRSLELFAGRGFAIDDAWALVRSELVIEARASVALWLLARKEVFAGMQTKELLSHFEELYVPVMGRPTASAALTRFVSEFDHCGAPEVSNLILEFLADVEGESVSGATAAYIRCAREVPGPERSRRVRELVERQPHSMVARRLRGPYIAILVARGELEKALDVIDDSGTLRSAKSAPDRANAYLRLLQAARNAMGVQFGDEKAAVSHTTIWILSRDLTSRLMDRGDFATSAELSFAVLKRGLVPMPPSLVNGRHPSVAFEMLSGIDESSIRALAHYLLKHVEAMVEGNDVSLDPADQNAPAIVLCYYLYDHADRAIDAHQYDIAAARIREALELLPDSPILKQMQTSVVASMKAAEQRAKRKRNAEAMLASAGRGDTDKALRQCLQAAEDLRTLRCYEAALGACLQIISKYPETGKLDALKLGIRTLRESGEKEKSERFRKWADQLERQQAIGATSVEASRAGE